MLFSRPLQAFLIALIGTAAFWRIAQVYHLGSDVLPKAPRLSSPVNAISLSSSAIGRSDARSEKPPRTPAALVELSVTGWDIAPHMPRSLHGPARHI